MSVKFHVMIEKPSNGIFTPGTEIKGIIKCYVNNQAHRQMMYMMMDHVKNYWVHQRVTTNICNIIKTTTVTTSQKLPKEDLDVGSDFEYPFTVRPHGNLPDIMIKMSSRSAWVPQDPDIQKVLYIDNEVYRPYQLATPWCFLPSDFLRFEKKLFSLRGTNVITLEVKIEQRFWYTGKYGKMTYFVNNNSNVDILSVKTDLYCFHTEYGTMGLPHTKVEIAGGRDSEEQQRRLGVPAGESANLTVQYPIPENQHTQAIPRRLLHTYEVRVVLTLPRPHRNLTARIPAFVGNKEDLRRATSSGNLAKPTYCTTVKTVKTEIMKCFCNFTGHAGEDV